MSLAVQFHTILSMIGMGVWVGAAIDTYSRFTRERRSFHWLTATNDILFWGIQGLIVFYILLIVNEGDMRFYVFVALLCGYAAYQGLFQRMYMHFLEWFIQFCQSVFRFFHFFTRTFFINPLKWILKLVYTLCMMLISTLLTIFLFLLKIIYKPIQWIGIGLLRITRLDRFVTKAKKSKQVEKAKRIIRRVLRRNGKEDE